MNNKNELDRIHLLLLIHSVTLLVLALEQVFSK